MGALLGISLWVALATVVPGLLTLTAIYTCLVAAGVDVPRPGNEWVMAGVALTAMVLTQALGILLEEMLMRLHLMGSRRQSIWIPDPGEPERLVEATIDPYELYRRLYIVLAQLTDDADSQGHLQRTLAQFFLTNNSLISFGSGLIVALLLTLEAAQPEVSRLLYCAAGFGVALVVSYQVAIIRFREMARSLWAIGTPSSTRRSAPPTS